MRLAVLLLAVSGLAWADTITFAAVCSGYRLVQHGADLRVYCPGKVDPWLTFVNCPKPKASTLAGNLSITCG